jgi:hypothetical protein
MDPRGGLQDSDPGGLFGAGLWRSRQRDIGATHEPARLGRKFLDIDMLIEHDDLLRPHLGNQPLADRREELQVKILPERILLDIGVHAREG